MSKTSRKTDKLNIQSSTQGDVLQTSMNSKKSHHDEPEPIIQEHDEKESIP